MAAYANILFWNACCSYRSCKERYGLKLPEKLNFRKNAQTTPRKSPAECAAEFEEEIEASNSMDSKNNQEKAVFSDTSETIQAFESV